MARLLKWLAWGAAAAALLLLAVAATLQWWLRSDDFRARVERDAAAALGVPVTLGRLSVDLLPLPAVAADRVRVQTSPAIEILRLQARPGWRALLAGRLEIETLQVRQALLPQSALAALGAAVQARDGPAGARAPSASQPGATGSWPRRLQLQDITWLDAKGQRLTLDGKATLGADGLLEDATFAIVAGRYAGLQGTLRREGERWPLRVEVGGGTIEGWLQLTSAARGARLLQAQLQTRGVEIAALTAPSRPLTGRLQADTSLRAEFRAPGQLLDMLQSRTRFDVRGAVVQGIDLARAVQTAGISRGGSTVLETLTGHVSTSGKAIRVTELAATSGALAASGQVAITPERALSGRVAVDLRATGGAVGVPLTVGGTLDAPTVTLSRGALLGAAVGTFIAPGLGTGAGAAAGDRIGDALRDLFGRQRQGPTGSSAGR